MIARDIEESVQLVASELASTAASRDKAGGTALTERALLRESGLLTLAVPRKLGGLGASWPVIFKSIRRLAEADSSLAHLFGFQHLQVATVLLFGSDHQHEKYLRPTVDAHCFWGNAINARDTRLKASRAEGGWQLDGIKSFCSGAKDSDVLIVSVSTGDQPSDRRYFVVPTNRDGITVNDDWDNMGQRQTDSGSVKFESVFISDTEQLGPPGAASSPRSTLRNIIAQIVLTEIYLGNALGAFNAAVNHVKAEVQPWAMAGVPRAVDDPMLQLRAGEQAASLRAAVALANEAAHAFQSAWDRGLALTEPERGELSMTVAAARITAGKTALDVTQKIFDLMGARATTARLGFDRYWRNVRVHTLHDPLDYRAVEIGKFTFTGEPPDPYGYG